MSNSSPAIAIVGIGCILPDSGGADDFWANVLKGHSALKPLSSDVHDWSNYARESERARAAFERPVGAQIGPRAFDWRKFRIAPMDARAINPMHLHVLEAGAQAIEEVKQLPHATTGVFVGGTGLGWSRDNGLRIRLPEFLDSAERAAAAMGVSSEKRARLLGRVQGIFEHRLKPVSDDAVVNSLASIAAGRLAFRYDLRGPHAAIDAGFASGLASVAEGVRLLRDGTLDLAIAGGASEAISPLDLLVLQELSVLAPNAVRPFDLQAEGTQLGEGVAMFALKRLEDAIANAERIYAVIRGVGASSDGASRSLLAPTEDGQILAMKRAYADAGLSPTQVGYVECHATGTPVGDACEIRALSRVFEGVSLGSVAVGSAKPFVGHLRGASGAVGLLRAVLALHHRCIPAQIGFERPHPNLGLDRTPFYVPQSQRPLEARDNFLSPCAAVNSVGLGGNNYHAVLEAWLPEAQPPKVCRTTLPIEPIAIVGLGGVLPNSVDVPAFWQSLLDGRDEAREIPGERWKIDRYFDPDHQRLDKSYTRIGCFVEPPPEPQKEFRVPPKSRQNIDPAHVIAFRAAEEAIADAKLEVGEWDRQRTGVIFGFLACQGRRFLAEARLNFREFEAEFEKAFAHFDIDSNCRRSMFDALERDVLAELPPITEDTLPGYLGSFIAARIAHRYNLQGPHFVVESACASSLAALQAATRLLRQNEVDTVLLGGVWADSQPEFFIGNCRFSALSATGITPFDEKADGFVPGEGAAVFVLRRLSDAERDGQRIHAVIRSIEGSSDGAVGRSIYAPSAEGEALAMRRALESAGVTSDQVDYVECHGTGTALGDLTEVEACTLAYTGRGGRPLFVGSVKSNIGHLMAGAGAAALLKTTLAIREGKIPATIKVTKPNPKIDFARGPVEVVTATRDWGHASGRVRRAGVSGFGLGGTNFHAILEEYRSLQVTTVPPSIRGSKAEHWTALPIATAQGGDMQACIRQLRAVADRAAETAPTEFLSVLRDSQDKTTGSGTWRVAVVASGPAQLAQRVKALESGASSERDLGYLRHQGIFVAQFLPGQRLAAIFPGQGPQYPNMLREAQTAFPELRRTLERIDRAYEKLCGRSLTRTFFVEEASNYRQSDEDIHCAVFAVNVALYSLLESYGARIDVVMGQSAGELAALVAARSISLEDGLRAVRERTLSVLAIQSADPGQMVALTCGSERVTPWLSQLPGYAALAADNGPSACIVSADKRALGSLLQVAAAEGIEAKVLAVSHGYHSQLIASAGPRYREVLDSMHFSLPQKVLYSTITGGRAESLAVEDFSRHLESQFVEPVRLRQAVSAMHRDGIELFVECGPKWPLTTFISEILAGQKYVAQATLHPKVGEVEQLHRAFACLFAHRMIGLSPTRNEVMSLPNASSSSRQKSEAPANGAPPSPDRGAEISMAHAGEAELLNVLSAIRDLADGALRRYGLVASDSDVDGPDVQVRSAQTSLQPVHAERSVNGESSVGASAHEPRSNSFGTVQLSPEPQTRDATTDNVARDVTPAATTIVPSEGHWHAELGLEDGLRHEVQVRLVSELVGRTGYPEDMLEPELDLEAELGIDTVKQVASLASVRQHFGLPADAGFRMQDARTLRQAVDYLVGRISALRQPMVVSSPAASAAGIHPEQVGQLQPRLALRPILPQALEPTPAPTAQPEAGSNARRPQEVVAEVRSRLVSELISRTGYPEEMLELELDLEAELGIDTVKQVAALAAVRAHFGLPPDPAFRMQDARTLRQAIDYMTARIVGAATTESAIGVTEPEQAIAAPARMEATIPSPAPIDELQDGRSDSRAGASAPWSESPSAPDILATLSDLQSCINSLVRAVSDGNPKVSPAIGMDAPGANGRFRANAPEGGHASRVSLSGGQASDWPANSVQEESERLSRSLYPQALLESLIPQAGPLQVGELLEVTGLAVGDSRSIPPDALPTGDNMQPLRAQDNEGQVVASSRRSRAPAGRSTVPPATLDAVREGRKASDDGLLRDYLARCGRREHSEIEWAHAHGFTVTVGGARIPQDDVSPSRSMLSLVGSAYDVTSYAWYKLTGALHSLSGIERMSFHRIPAAGEEILVCARMARPEGGFWRADVSLFDRTGELFAELVGMEGAPMDAGGVGLHDGNNPADRVWRRYSQRLGRDSSGPEKVLS